MLQKRAVRIIAGDKYLAHTYKELDFMKFSNINKHLTGVRYKSIKLYLNNLPPNLDANQGLF